MRAYIRPTFGGPTMWGMVVGISRHPGILIFWLGFFTIGFEWDE